MRITSTTKTIRELARNYVDSEETGVLAYNRLLTVRPAYQREFVYKDKQRNAVIDTVIKGFPLGTIYWVDCNDHFELLDGQQRTISICQFVNGDFAIKHEGNTKYFSTFSTEVQNRILDYQLSVYICQGTDDEKLDWFRTINIAGEKLTDQELLNINYIGPWLSAAKVIFSKNNCAAYNLGKNFIKGSPIRQDFLETALTWIDDQGDPSHYMALHKNDRNADELWNYFRGVITWITTTFEEYYKEMSGLNWGELYREYHNNTYNPIDIKAKVVALMADDEITNKKGIFEYVLSNETVEKVLNLRAFTETQKRTAYTQQKGICPICGKEFAYEDMEGDHIIPWSAGGKTEMSNLQMLCKECNRAKSNH